MSEREIESEQESMQKIENKSNLEREQESGGVRE